MDHTALGRFMGNLGIAVFVSGDPDSGAVEVFGEPDLLESDEVIHQYFRDPAVLRDSLQGRIKPRMVQHGAVFGCIFELADGRVGAFLYNDESSPVERYQRAKRLYEAVPMLEQLLKIK